MTPEIDTEGIEVRLLEEMAMDVGFAIDVSRSEAAWTW